MELLQQLKQLKQQDKLNLEELQKITSSQVLLYHVELELQNLGTKL